ncbi:molybdenum cofactor biosynthesis protein MoaE [Parapedobacter tibetensis]|uniref:molybdenum cofactor biosynthesis protein MoaE n=1 Tax=Parapedobacter tibetensis TaxID=2972951 RepID=UPI00214D58F8|nr:molybdenum cofactor biosynthesis protein MoaE [Parapedobacter tibetensis]
MKRLNKLIFFNQGAIPATRIADIIQHHGSDISIGAYSIFLGQVRADLAGNDQVSAISYTAYEDMALEKMEAIGDAIFEKYAITGMEVIHSLGEVATGEICLCVVLTAAHRKAAMDACSETVELIKSELPIWGKEHLTKEGHQWKINTTNGKHHT